MKTLILKLYFLSLLIYATSALAQTPPGAMFQIETDDTSGGTYSSPTYVDSGSWSPSMSISTYGVSSSISGNESVTSSAGGASFSFGTSGNSSGTATGGGYGSGPSGLQAEATVQMLIKGGSTVTVGVSAISSASGTITAGSGQSGGGVDQYTWISGLPASISTTSSASASGSQSGSYIDHGSCYSASNYPPSYPTTGYRNLGSLHFVQFVSPENNFSGTLSSGLSGGVTLTIGADNPVPLIAGPSVSGTPVSHIDAGTSVSFDSSASFDPDDSSDNGGVYAICSRLWTLHWPDSSTTTSTSISFSTTLTETGPYTIELKVTDNEGKDSTTTKSFLVSDPRICTPGTPQVTPECKTGDTKIGVKPLCGKITITNPDPAKTRGYPLKNDIAVTSNVTHATNSWMGNGFFSYGIQIALLTSGGGTQRILIDGNGDEYDYGLSTSGSNPKTKGVYPTLTAGTSGFTLSGAGGPDEIYKAGNFTYDFDSQGRLLTITDPNGNAQTVSYNTGNKPIIVTDISSGRTIVLDYGTNGKISKLTENGGFAYRELTYDTSNRITAITTKDSAHATVRSIAMTYDSSGRIATMVKDGDVATTKTLSYVDGGLGVSLGNITDSDSSTNIEYFSMPPSGSSFRSTTTNAKGGVTTYDFDSDGNLKTITEPPYNGTSSPVVHSYTYDSNKNLLTDSNGTSTVTYIYNSLGLMTHEQNAAGAYKAYTYSGVDLTKIEDNAGTISEFLYANTSLPHAISGFKDGAGNTWTIARNSFGQVTSVTPPSGSPTGTLTFAYEETTSSPNYGYLKTVTNGAGDVSTVNSYTSLGDPTSVTTNPASGVTRTVQATYDGTQREMVKTHGDGKTVQTSYTGGNMTGVTDEAGTLTQYTYCPTCGKLTGVSGPLSWSLGWVLDGDKDVTTFTDALSHNTTYSYGYGRELKQITYPDSTGITYNYDRFGRLQSYHTGRDYPSLSYDSASRLTEDGYNTFTYDSAGRLSSALSDPSNNTTVTYTYASNRKVASEIYSRYYFTTQTVQYTYNPDQTINTLTWKNGSTTVASWSYSYDGAGRVSSVYNGFGETTSFTYDGEGKILTESNANGTSRNYTYNNQRGWPTQIKYKSGTTTTSQYDLTYDGGANTVGNITGVTELSGATVTYTYDDLYRLTSETRSASPSYSRTYGYDLAGNPTTLNSSSFASYDSANKITQVLGQSVTNDADGNVSSIAATSPFAFSGFSWTGNNKTSTVSLTGGGTINYEYLFNGKRFSSISSVGSDTSKNYYIFAGEMLIGVIGNSPAAPKAAYTWGPDGLISKYDLSSSASSWYEFGPQGETRKLTDASAMGTDAYNYNAYGDLVSSTGSTENAYRFGGKYGYYSDLNSNLILATQRWYSPQMMRWISRDPIGYFGGTNLYTYVRSNPVKFSDSSGLSTDDEDVNGEPEHKIIPVDPAPGTGVIDLNGDGKPDIVGIPNVGGGGTKGNGTGNDGISKTPPRGWGADLPTVGGPSNGSNVAGSGNAGTIRDYDDRGRVTKDNDFGHDHGYGDPHIHDWYCDKDGKLRRTKKGRPPGPGE